MKLINYKLIIYYLSVFMIMIGVIQLIPLIVLPFYPEEVAYAPNFIIVGILSIFLGYIFHLFFKKYKDHKLEQNHHSILVLLVWVIAILVSAIPWMLTGKYNFTQAVFEMTSGYSTTGLSVVDVGTTPHIYLFFRSITLFIGGIGLVLILTSAISDRYGLHLYNAEGHNDKLLPNLAKSARMILTIYSIYILIGSIAYVSAGMNAFDAINHSIAALSTGGFSTNVNSIFGYNSLAIEIITMVLMLLGGTNFVIHYYLIRGNFAKLKKHSELYFFLLTIIIVLPMLTLNYYFNNDVSVGQSVRVSLFQFISSITTTGFQSVATMTELPFAFISIMIILMLIGGNLESTAGGIKQYRIIVSLKGIWYNIVDSMSNKRIIKTRYINRAGRLHKLDSKETLAYSSYVLLYLIIFILGSLVFTSYGYNLQDAMFEFSSSLSTVGLSVGIISYSAPPLILWTSIAGMIIGRLEIFVIFQAIIRIINDIRQKELM